MAWDGYIYATKPRDFIPIQQLLEANKPPKAIIEKTVEVMREIASRPASNKMIGNEVIASTIMSMGGAPSSTFFPDGISDSLHHIDIVNLCSDAKIFISNVKLSVPNHLLFDPKTPRNALCPCKSGKRYKRCHGQKVNTEQNMYEITIGRMPV